MFIRKLKCLSKYELINHIDPRTYLIKQQQKLKLEVCMEAIAALQ